MCYNVTIILYFVWRAYSLEIKSIKSSICGNTQFLDILKFNHYNPSPEKLDRLSKTYMEDEKIYPFAAFDEDKVLGFIVIKELKKQICGIIDIAVHEDYRELGIASKLIDYVMDNFDIKILCAETDYDTAKFYEKYRLEIESAKANTSDSKSNRYCFIKRF